MHCWFTLTYVVICAQAYKLGMYGKRYQWINWDVGFGYLPEIEADVNDGCTREQLLKVTDSAITIKRKFISEGEYNSKIGVTGKVIVYLC